MVGERHQTAVGSSADSGTWAQQTRRELEISWLGPMKRSLSREPYLTLAKRFSRVLGTRHKVSVFKVRETRHKVSVFKVREKREPFGLSLRPWRGRWRFSRWKWNFRK
jgi:hypothetical protein